MTTTTKSKTVSAILPNYNYAHFFCSRLQEILSQTYQVSEIIILDDNSTDKSREIILPEIAKLQAMRPDIAVKHCFNRQNSGNVFSQWQKGIELSSAEYIWICELDDSAKPKFLETVMAPFKDDNVVLSFCNSKMINQKGELIIKDNLRKIKDFFRRRHVSGEYVVDGLTEINRSLAVFNSIPNVSATIIKNQPSLTTFLEEAKKYRLCGDWYFYLKVAAAGKIAYTNKTLNLHRIHSDSVTKKTALKERFAETKSIHQFARNTFKLQNNTIRRMEKIEIELAKKWKIKDN